MNTLKIFWNFCSNFGVHTGLSDGEIKRIKITNQLCVLAFICYLFYDFTFLFLQIPIFQFDYFITGIIFLAVLFLNYKGNSTAAKVLLCTILYYGVFSMMFFYGKTFETNLLLFPVLQVPFFLFDTRQKKLLLLTSIIPFACFLYINMSGISNPGNLIINEEQIALMKSIVQITAILLFFMVIYFYSQLNTKSEQSLTSKFSLLQEQLQTVFENSSDALLVINTENNCISNINRGAVELFEATQPEDLIGKQVPDFHRDKLNSEQLIVIRKNLKQRKFWSGEIEFETLKGKAFWGDLSVKRIDTSHLPYQLVRISDITQRKNYETRLQASIREKEILIEEIHHRVKNNLAIVSGLLHLQSMQIEDKKLLELFDECRRRIKSMALIHEKLYINESFEKIDFSDYVNSLLDSIQSSYNTSSAQIKVNTDIKDVHLELKHAIPCALILNELISNSYKHAFVGKESGTIKIEITKQDATLSMHVIDDGIGIQKKEHQSESVTLGLTLVDSLVSQINGNLLIQNNNGTHFQLTLSI